MATPFVTVIIPVRDDPRLTQCLAALAAQTYPVDSLEVLVVDNGSVEPPDEARRVLPQARMITEEKPGSYAARNAALAEARGDILAFTDADCLPCPDWLTRGVEAVTSVEKDRVVGGRIELTYERPCQKSIAEVHEAVFGFRQREYVELGHYAATANMLTRRRVFDRVGPFNANTLSGGDREWGRRAFAAGMELRYTPDAVVRHPARATVGELLAKRRRVTLGQCALAKTESAYKYALLIKLIKFLPSVRYRIGPALRASQLTPGQRIRLALFCCRLHFYEYGLRLARVHYLLYCPYPKTKVADGSG